MKGTLAGVIHLPPLPGSPRCSSSLRELRERAESDARALADAGFEWVVVENYGDAPFFASQVPSVTVAAVTACALAVRDACPDVRLVVNVLRNDASAALAIAHVAGAHAIRVNVHSGARVTDQGIVEGSAARTLRERRALGANVSIWADVAVKHSDPLGTVGADAAEREARDLAERALADVLLVTGEGTGLPVDVESLAAVRRAVPDRPRLVASGATLSSLSVLASHADGVIVGSALRADGRAGGPIDPDRARAFAAAFARAWS